MKADFHASDVGVDVGLGGTGLSRARERALLRARGLRLAYDRGRTCALDGVDLDVARGEFVAITGPSGCGKSSLLNLVGLLDAPSAGRLFLGDQAYDDVRDAAAFRREHFGFVFQSFQLIPTLTALENVMIPTVGLPAARAEARARARRLLADVGLSHRENHRPPELSGGERQRVAIARALVNEPTLLIADEPTGALDSANARQVLDVIAGTRAARGITVLMVTHDAEVSARADRVVPMRDGRVDRVPELAACA